MLRLLANLTLSILANAVGLLAAALALDNFSIDAAGFITAVLIFSIATTILGPLIVKIALTSANYLVGGIALVTTLVGLIITDVVSDHVTISGVTTWAVATLVVWLFSIIGSVLLPLVIFKNVLQKKQSDN
ncbi:phage holin family protein [Candidatus Saccharibacteria bacterium]|nr:phage holin family protein [Candidatus Saccharibacteria bacterium]